MIIRAVLEVVGVTINRVNAIAERFDRYPRESVALALYIVEC